jgi:hypothetical protein
LLEIFVPDAHGSRGYIMDIVLSHGSVDEAAEAEAVVAEDEKRDDDNDDPLDESPIGSHVR